MSDRTDTPSPTTPVRPDAVATARQATLPDPNDLPAIPASYVELSAEQRRRLRVLADTERPEALGALLETAGRGANLSKELGDLVSTPERMLALATRVRDCADRLVQTRAHMHFLEDVLAVAEHDAVQMLEDAKRELEVRRKRNAQLSTLYPALEAFFRNRKNAVVQGKAKAKKAREKQPG